ncbi:XRE family transcriptional regulator [Apilactobacillus timberlakei]|uniref:helix-turn-helix domain-containing protein n=1 Tax=Apilactobacillus timberlakei TaxID=2008380 RepID=UPI001128619A|nr:helix-turn-helix transcriptional regulator [Apilactobacillus timberlakei]TPR15031.1 XRE family transcriptional regulator [Apilactobacillus timberlakei]
MNAQKYTYKIINNYSLSPEVKIFRLIQLKKITYKNMLKMSLSPVTIKQLQTNDLNHSISLISYNKFMYGIGLNDKDIMTSLGLPFDIGNNNLAIGNYIRSLRASQDISREKLSKQTNFSVAKISHIEKGKVKKILIRDIYKIVKILQGKHYKPDINANKLLLNILSSIYGSEHKRQAIYLLPQIVMIKNNISIKDLAATSNLSIYTIRKISNQGNISFKKYVAIMKALNFSDFEINEAIGIKDSNVQTNIESISKYIHIIRMNNQISLDLLANETNITRNAISHIELNKNTNLSGSKRDANPLISNVSKIISAIYKLSNKSIKTTKK